ncbi:MAG: SPOR domain-containing protein [Acidobacteria bacterium]|nr:SPOR domain-containing protein [Acidobacteriota bacterium]
MSQQIQDDGFREIQLNGKQLVFLFMAATVVSVVIFLCGVLVGRGVKAERSAAADATPINIAAETTPQPPVAAPPPTPAGSDPTSAAPPPAVDDLSYFNRLEKPNAPAEQLKPASAKSAGPAAAPTAAAAPAEKAARAEARQTPSPPPAAKAETRAAPAPPPAPAPSSDGYAVQIAALNERDEADAIAKRLSSKGYSAYVLAPAAGTPAMYRVRIGKFATKHEADTMAAKLQKEEQFKPWVTR